MLDRCGPRRSGERARPLSRLAGGASSGRCLLWLGVVPRAISRCPECRQPVSQFAAGCAVCGTDLQAARAERAKRPHLPGSLPPLGDDALRIGVTVLAALFSPLLTAAFPPAT